MGVWGKVTGEDDDEGAGGALGSVARGAVGGMAGGPAGAIAGSNVKGAQKTVSQTLGMDRSKQKELGEESQRAGEEEIGARGGVLQGMNTADEEYAKKYGESLDQYNREQDAYDNTIISTINRNQQQARDQASNAQTVYTNDIQPRMKSSMEDAQREASSAMSLADAGNPNSAYQKQIRGMYDELGQGEMKQGIADFGVLSALGSQATQNTMGSGGPMTGAQLQLLGAQNQQQASGAYQAARRRMDALKQQGIERGFDESGKQYERGQMAKDRYRQSIGDYEGGLDRNIARQGRFRDEDVALGERLHGVESGVASRRFGGAAAKGSLQRGNVYNRSNRELSQLDAIYGNRQAGIANQIAEANAENAQKSGMIGGILQAGATGAGAYYGGAQGAKTGNMIGGSVAGGMQSQPPPQQGFQRQRREYQYA